MTLLRRLRTESKKGFAYSFRNMQLNERKMSGQIFICYRREETDWVATSMYNRLIWDFPPGQIFMDIHRIPLGEDFVEVIQATVAACDVLIAIIGKNWVDAKDDNGKRRLDNPGDFVRTEIAAALKHRILEESCW